MPAARPWGTPHRWPVPPGLLGRQQVYPVHLTDAGPQTAVEGWGDMALGAAAHPGSALALSGAKRFSGGVVASHRALAAARQRHRAHCGAADLLPELRGHGLQRVRATLGAGLAGRRLGLSFQAVSGDRPADPGAPAPGPAGGAGRRANKSAEIAS